jgi:hypothetical protein
VFGNIYKFGLAIFCWEDKLGDLVSGEGEVSLSEV